MNLNDFPIKVRMETRAIIGGKDYGEIRDEKGYYSGKTLWNINPRLTVFGNFNAPRDCLDNSLDFKIEIKVTIIDYNNKEFSMLPVSWTYMRNKNSWFFEPKSFTNSDD